jgi:hypothetical protein
MTIEQTVEIPQNHVVTFKIEVPKELPAGTSARILITIPRHPHAMECPPLTPLYLKSLCAPKPQNGLKPEEALENMFGCSAGSGDTLDAYMERRRADNDLERAIEHRREKEREHFRRRTGS